MCTVSYFRETTRLLLTMNRDERRDRSPELPPVIEAFPQGVQWIHPRDSARGGTWIGVNDRGVSACLLNRYLPDALQSDRRQRPSRGFIIPRLLQNQDVGQARRWLAESLNVRDFEPFTLLISGLTEGWVAEWSGGEELQWHELSSGWQLLTSSSWNTEAVHHWRRRAFNQWLANGRPFDDRMPRFNTLRPPGEEAFSPWMSRPKTHTRSITQVEIRGRAIYLRYWHPLGPIVPAACEEQIELVESRPREPQ